MNAVQIREVASALHESENEIFLTAWAHIKMEIERRLYRSKKNRVIAGVCGGLGEYFGIDPVLIRLIWVVFALGYGAGILAYLIAWLIIPKKN